MIETVAWKRAGQDSHMDWPFHMRLMVMRRDTQIGSSIIGANFGVYSMHEAFGSRLSLSILYDVLSWMIDVVNW